jgi:preprotein translocase subunit YajC
MTQQLILLLPLFAVYFGMIHPRQKAMKLAQEANRNIVVGTRVMTTSGIHGTVRAIDDKVASLEIAPGVEIRIERRAIAKALSDASETLSIDATSTDTPTTEASA